ncbi:MAG TPA: GNAT family N-acetyltransferase [Nocardioides sp.]|nr:GNAT family N-acetyltransferase [Nocardioides sp.]
MSAPSDLRIRPAVPGDIPRIAEVQLAAREASPMPPGLHPVDEIRDYLAAQLGPTDLWVAESEGRIVGYARVGAGWLHDLYVEPGAQGRGVGGALLAMVKGQQPDGFCLWVFVSNVPARDFYAARGLVEVERTDGAGNEEKRPDVRMQWRG